jgi:DNA mismatch repair protein MutS
MVKPLVDVYHMDVYFDKVQDVLVYNRTILPGQGSELYGLEVCKALDMDPEFLDVANKIRVDFMKTPRKTKYNSKVIVDKCGICGNPAHEVHHILEQHTADAEGYIGYIHKNQKSNLVPLCGTCHDRIHKKEITVEGFKTTNRGKKLIYA